MIEPTHSTGSAAAGTPASSSTKPDAVSRGFEQLLVQQLASQLLKTAGDAGDKYASLLPNALAQAVQDGGGLGLDLDPPKASS